MFTKSQLSRSVNLAFLCGAATLISSNAFAQEQQDEASADVEKIEVTGSRISRGDMETALPVTVISAEEIAATGLPDISAVIAQMPFNSQGSFVSAASSSATNHSSSGLRGLGSKRTLTLINGKRIAPSATFSGESTNLNLIPLEAVEKIDILRDGASAIYGSDAIGGVINIILKKDFEGLMAKVFAARPSADSGDEEGFSITTGARGEKGSYLFVFEHKKWEGIRFGTRKPLHSSFGTGDNDPRWNVSTLYSPYGTYRELDADGKPGPWKAGKNCPADSIVDLGAAGKRCGYRFLEGKNYIPARTKDSAFANFNYEISDDISLNTQIMALRDTTNTASTSVWTPGGIVMAADNPNNPTFGTANPVPVRAYTRLVGVADRETDFNTYTYDISSELTWELDSGTFIASAQASRQNVDVSTEHYIFRNKLDEAVQSGKYNPFVPGGNATQETLNSFLHTATRKASSRTKGLNLTWVGELPVELEGGTIGYAVGGEYQSLSFSDKLDRQSAPGGSAFPTFGGNSGGERNYKAVFAEFDIPVLDNLTVKAATRYDKYSMPDEGQLSSNINARYEVLDNLVLRASYSQGFRVPSLDDLLSEEALSFNRVTDTKLCRTLTPEQQKANPFCSDGVQIERRSAGNPKLKPETSDQFAFGVIWDITDSIDLTVDYYNIQINDQVQFLGAQDVVDLEAAGLLDTFDRNAVNVIRDANGVITNVQTGSINQKGNSTDGIDLEFNAKYDMGDMGTLFYAFGGSYVLSYETQSTPLAKRYDEVGSFTTPEFRFNTSLGYSIGEFDAKLTYRHIKGHKGETVVQEIAKVEVDDFKAWKIFDLNMAYDFDSYGKITAGVRNLTNELPELNTAFRFGFNTSQQNVLGRVYYASYTIKF